MEQRQGVLAALLARAVLVLLHAVYQVWMWARGAWRAERAQHVSRSPAHLAAVFDLRADTPRAHLRAALADTIFLIRQCAAGGASELSIYDRDGRLAAMIPEALHGRAAAGLCVSLARAGSAAETIGEKPAALRVNLLSSADDKPAVAAAAAAAPGHTIEAVTEELRRQGPTLSDPDMVVVKSARHTLCGFPCWYIRTSTIWCVHADRLCVRLG